MRALTLMCVLSMAMMAEMQNKSESQTVPPDVKKTVDVLLGKWSFQGTDSEPGTKEPQKVNMEIDCKPAALGTAVACTLKGTVTGFGPVEASAIVGYDPEGQIVHWMEISSTGEYHDHKGKWEGNVMMFQPLVYTVLGKRSTERLTLRFRSSEAVALESETATTGGTSTIRGAAKRRQ